MSEPSIKVGVIADQTGPLSFMGIANANVARMVIDDINAKGGLLGRQIDLFVEDGATTDSVAEAKATKLVQHDQVDVIFGGIYSSTRQAIKGPAVDEGQEALHLPGAVRGAGMRPAHLLHRSGAGAAGRAAHSLADAGDGREEILPAVRRLHLAARAEQEASARSSPPTAARSSARSTSPSITPTTARRSRRSRPAAPRSSSTRSFRPGSRRSSSSSTTPASRSAADTSSARTSTRTS